MTSKWTDQQQDAIDTVDRSVIVSAAAGSGKTAVLAERCVRLVVEPEIACDVDRLLVVTFTNDAAEEMRSRIEQNLRARLEANPDDLRLEKQLFLLQRAQISTIHGFCNRIVQQHFHLLGLDPGISLMQAEEAALLRTQIAREVVHRRYSLAAPEAFENLLEWYFDGNDERLVETILRLDLLLTSVIDPRTWARKSRDSQREAIAQFTKSDIAQNLAAQIATGMRDVVSDVKAFLDRYGSEPSLAHYAKAATEIQQEAAHRMRLAEAADFDGLSHAYANYKPDRMPSKRVPDRALLESAKNSLEPIRKQMSVEGTAGLCQYSTDEWVAGLRSTESSAVQLLSLTLRFSRAFQRAKLAIRSMDFSDLERFALQILSRHPEVARLYKEQFCHVLVDEFQDINDVQAKILSLVSREAGAEIELPANLFTVGDVKQSIYRFRLADPKLFLQRYHLFHTQPSARRRSIDLQANFRSREPLLEAINCVFERLMSIQTAEVDYDDTHRLIANALYPYDPAQHFFGTPVELHLIEKPPRSNSGTSGTHANESNDTPSDELDRTEREAAFVAHRIRELMSGPMQVCEKQDGGLCPVPLQYRHIVVLMRSRTVKARQFSEQLQKAGIPVHADTGSGFFDSIEIRDCIALLQLLDNQQQDIPMAAVLRSPFARLSKPEDALARIRMRFRGDRFVPFHQAATKYPREAGDALAGELSDFFTRLHRWRELAHRKPLAEVIAMIFNESGYLTWCSGLPNGQQRVANLLSLLERARQFGSFQRQGLGRFIDFLGKLEEESDLGEPSLLGEGENAVRILTIHRSKGLEFPVVFVADLGKAHNLQDERSAILAEREFGLALDAVHAEKRIRYPSATSVLVQNRIHNASMAEELRVLYVAMTRAREHLILVGTCGPEEVEEWRERYANWQGCLPASEVLRGKTFLSWLVPCAFSINSHHPGTFDLTQHSIQEIQDIVVKRTSAAKETIDPWLRDFKPLQPAPARTETAAVVISAMSAKYPHHALTTVPATQAVTAIAKQRFDDPVLTARQRANQRPLNPLLPPRFILGDSPLSAADAGTATHLVLQHLDFSAAQELSSLESQIVRLVESRLLLASHAEVVDRESICWLMTTDLGAMLKQYNATLKRELPVYFPQPAAGASGLDQVMIRGRVDVLIPTSDGLVLVDYKTDRVNAVSLIERLNQYQPQLRMYGEAIQAIAGHPVLARYVVFLDAKEVRSV